MRTTATYQPMWKTTKLLLWLSAALILSACGSQQSAAPDKTSAASVKLLPADTLEEDVFYEQKITVTWPEGKRSFRAVLQKVDDELSIVGMSLIGQPAFRITLHDQHVTMERMTHRTLPFPPEYIVADVQRAFYPWPTSPTDNDSTIRTGEALGMTIHEHHSQGKLASRTFYETGTDPAKIAHVNYRYSEQELPPSVEVENIQFGYTIFVETVAVQDIGQH